MPYIEFVGPPGCGKTTAVNKILRENRNCAPGRRSLITPISCLYVNRFGFPPDGLKMWFRVLCVFPYALMAGLKFWFDTKSVLMGSSIVMLLIKSRVLAASSHVWIVDQGLQQQVLSALAHGFLSHNCAGRWQSFCLSRRWRPVRIMGINSDKDELIYRIKNSEKHILQCGTLSPEVYADRFLSAYTKLLDGLIREHNLAIFEEFENGMDFN